MKGSGQTGDGAYVSAADLACRRGDHILFEGLSFAVRAGQVLHITGANGVGKSSLMRMVAGLLRPFDGHLEHAGEIVLADERPALDMDQPLESALGLWAALDGRNRRDVGAAMARLEVAHLADLPVRYLSTGQRKRAVLARMRLSRGAIWLMDEPANGLDIHSTDLLGSVMEEHLANGGLIIAASHISLPVTGTAQVELGAYKPVRAS